MIPELAQRLILLRAGGIALMAVLLALCLAVNLPLAYEPLFIIGVAWLLLHGFILISQQRWQTNAFTIALQLIADVIIVASLLAFSGGVHNPFFALLLLPLLLTAGILPIRWHYVLLSVVIVVATLLILVPAPLNSAIPTLPNSLYQFLFLLDGSVVRNTPFNPLDVLAKLGLWLNVSLMAILVTFFLSRLHQRLYKQQHTLQQTENEHREQQYLLNMSLSAASTAHELSTPLATMSLLASEAADAYQHQEPQTAQDALAHIQQLIRHCKHQISTSLRQHQLERSDQLGYVPWPTYVQQVIAHWQALQPHVKILLNVDHNGYSPPEAIDLPVLTHTIASLLTNASEASTHPIALKISWDTRWLTLAIHNGGAGFSSELLAHFPQPHHSTKETGHGMGLTLAHANIQRLGGQLTLHNPHTGGAKVILRLPINPQHWLPIRPDSAVTP